MKSVIIPIDDEMLFVLKKDLASVSKEIRASVAMQYFKERKLGLGLAAKMAGISKHEFTVYLGENKVDIFQYTDEELCDEFVLVDEISGVAR